MKLPMVQMMSKYLCKPVLPEQNSRVSGKGPEDKEDAGDDPGRDRGQALDIGRVARDVVEDVDQHEEEGDQEGHSPRDDLRWDQEAYL